MYQCTNVPMYQCTNVPMFVRNRFCNNYDVTTSRRHVVSEFQGLPAASSDCFRSPRFKVSGFSVTRLVHDCWLRTEN